MVENKKTERWSTPLKVAVVVLVVLAVFSVIGYPTLTGHAIIECEKEVLVPYDAQETYTVSEPYTTQECHDVPYQDTVEVPLSYLDVGHGNTMLLGIGFRGYVDIKNTDTEPGTFNIDCFYDLANQPDRSSTGTMYINPGATGRVTCGDSVPWGTQVGFTYTITPGTKTEFVTKYRTECNSVTKYHDVEETRTVTKYKNVTVTSFSVCLGD